ncbi:MAG: hypothetical protein P9X24_01020 [Candidatus Hatepunaea meridiana]|nr:hypothetical protein [Candidatus Hatepunaea meridiana]
MIYKIIKKLCLLGLLILLFIVHTGCKDGNGKSHSEFKSRAKSILESPEIEMKEVVGESLITGKDEKVNNRIRIAALIDGLRNLTIGERSITYTTGQVPDTLIYTANWSGLLISVRTIRLNGVLLSDAVRVTYTDVDDPRLAPSWCIQNLKLVHPIEGKDTQFAILKNALIERGFSFTNNYQIGENVWREELNYKVLQNKG